MSTENERAVEEIAVPAGVKFTVGPGSLTAKGPLGTVVRPFPSDVLELTASGASVHLKLLIPAERKRSQSLLHTWAAHLRNIAGGLTVGVEAKM
jgi:ribosomal protein L6P/L9E